MTSCPDCTGPMEEDVRGRDLGEMVLCRFLPLRALQAAHGTFMPVHVRMKDELVKRSSLELGLEYDVIGVQKGDSLEAWNIVLLQNRIEALIKAPYGHTVPLPPDVAALYLQIRESHETSPWAFTTALVTQLAADILPQSSFLHLKLGLLLSLASQKRGCSPVGVVAVGADTLIAQTLMSSAAQLAELVVASAGDSLEGTIKLDSSSNLVWEEAGDLSLAAYGVCLLGDWAKHRRRVGLSAAVASVETGLVTMESRVPRSLMPPTTLPLRSCVWTYWGDISRSARDQLQLRTLIDVFGMPFLTDEADPLEYERVCGQLLEAATSVGDEHTREEDGETRDFIETRDYDAYRSRVYSTDRDSGSRGSRKSWRDRKAEVAPDGLRELLRIVTSRDVHLTQSASDLIKNYFVASRRERPECLPVGAVRTITSLAEAHARLALRQQVLPADVALVIFLYQEAICTLFGSSQISAYEKLNWDQEEPTYAFVHRQMTRFSDWLDNYILSF